MWRYETEPSSDTREDAVSYWSQVKPYTWVAPWNDRIAAAVAEYQPASVLEFGCSAGRNLFKLRDLLPDASLVGIDINERAVEAGRNKWGLDLRVGGVDELADYEADLAFTVSVIDHLPDPLPAIEHLAAVAPIVLLFEPWLGTEGKLTQRLSEETGEAVEVTPFSYSWDYVRLARELALPVTEEPFPLETTMGPHYKLFRIERDESGVAQGPISCDADS